ncbi:SNF2-related protein [Nocardia seriolae]|uniref:SNF2-related protein n=1 Tax=Nocardia seriolae TaxID=37332 RepID=UPI001F02849D|nr:SNF2-related protein [Nocardia seriolae]
MLGVVGADRYLSRFRLDQFEVAKLRGSASDQLRSLGIEVAWEADWVHVTAEVVVSSRTDPTQVTGRFGLGELLDRRWRYLADNIEIDPGVLTQLRAAELPWIMHRNKWILIDDITRDKLLAKWTEEIPVAQGMLEVLSGWVTIGGRSFRCTPVGGLAALIDELRRTDHAAVVAQARRECPIDLYPHQATALAWLLRLADLGFHGLLADDMGLGKTITAIAFHLSDRRPDRGKPTLLVAPNWTLIKKWKDEIETFAPSANALLYRGPNRNLDQTRKGDWIVLTSYKLIEQGDAALQDQRWGLVIADEAQEIKNPATIKARSMRSLHAAVRLALTGTPVENHAGELRAILDWCNPGLFGTAAQFHTRCVRPIEDAVDSASREAARLVLQRHLCESVLVDLLCGVGSCCGRVGFVDESDRGSVRAVGAARAGPGVRVGIVGGAGAQERVDAGRTCW